MAISVLDTLELPVTDRLRLVAEIWESIAETPDAIQLTPKTRRLLAERLEAHRKNPNTGSPWAEVKNRLLKK
jgi:putative addiction module component (TIGR02574 family)